MAGESEEETTWVHLCEIFYSGVQEKILFTPGESKENVPFVLGKIVKVNASWILGINRLVP